VELVGKFVSAILLFVLIAWIADCILLCLPHWILHQGFTTAHHIKKEITK